MVPVCQNLAGASEQGSARRRSPKPRAHLACSSAALVPVTASGDLAAMARAVLITASDMSALLEKHSATSPIDLASAPRNVRPVSASSRAIPAAARAMRRAWCKLPECALGWCRVGVGPRAVAYDARQALQRAQVSRDGHVNLFYREGSVSRAVAQVGCGHNVDAAAYAGALDRGDDGDRAALQCVYRLLVELDAAQQLQPLAGGARRRQRRATRRRLGD